MMSVIFGWSSGYQSMTLLPSRMSTNENLPALPGSDRGLVCSPSSSLGRSAREGGCCGTAFSPGAGGVGNPYAQSGCCVKSTAVEDRSLRGAVVEEALASTGPLARSYSRCAIVPAANDAAHSAATPSDRRMKSSLFDYCGKANAMYAPGNDGPPPRP